MSVREIGCCGAYCRTCRAYTSGFCRGCKLGYENGKRDINRAKCKMKLCCFRGRNLATCADCPDYPCRILNIFLNKKGREKYRRQLEFIKEHGYKKFIAVANKWKDASGRLS
jgi:hypothetical protein